MIKKINIELLGTSSSKPKDQAYSNCEYRDKAGKKVYHEGTDDITSHNVTNILFI